MRSASVSTCPNIIVAVLRPPSSCQTRITLSQSSVNTLPRVIARRIAPNRRLLCATPSYLARYGNPKTPGELVRHNCIGIRQGDEAYGVWRLRSGRSKNAESVKVRGNLATNDGAIAVQWALAGTASLMVLFLVLTLLLGRTRRAWRAIT